MLRNFGISLLLFGLFLAGTDGFRSRDGNVAPSTGTTTEAGNVHMAEGGVWWPK